MDPVSNSSSKNFTSHWSYINCLIPASVLQMFWWTHSKCQKLRQSKKQKIIQCYMPCLFCNLWLPQNNQLDYEHMLSSIGVTFLLNLWILCSKCIHRWNHVCRISKNFTNAKPHTLFVTCRKPISLFIHVFTKIYTYIYTYKRLFLIVWLEIWILSFV